jgi:hypothetical protein
MSFAGSVTVAPDGTASGSGVALALYTLLLGQPSYAGIPAGAAGVPGKKQLAEVCNTFSTIADAPRFLMPAVQNANFSADVDSCVLCDISAAGFTVTIPPPGPTNAGHMIAVKNITSNASNSITVEPTSGFIEGASSITITGALASVLLVASPASSILPCWNVIAKA